MVITDQTITREYEFYCGSCGEMSIAEGVQRVIDGDVQVYAVVNCSCGGTYDVLHMCEEE